MHTFGPDQAVNTLATALKGRSGKKMAGRIQRQRSRDRRHRLGNNESKIFYKHLEHTLEEGKHTLNDKSDESTKG